MKEVEKIGGIIGLTVRDSSNKQKKYAFELLKSANKRSKFLNMRENAGIPVVTIIQLNTYTSECELRNKEHNRWVEYTWTVIDGVLRNSLIVSNLEALKLVVDQLFDI